MSGARNIGVLAVETYYPHQCVEQSDLEQFDGVSAGKYTIGLGQTRMGFCDDREDIYSLALTTVHNLLEKNNIPTESIGRLEVGTETILDKSKSVKSVLMQLFRDNAAIEGVDTVNACYGSTNALFNAINWIESSAWDGRNAIVVAGDIALYAQGNARPTGGAGCVAMLIGPDAPIVFDAGLRGTFMAHVYDFYKPDLTSEYPIVDGYYSLACYTRALDSAYNNYKKTVERKINKKVSASFFDFAIFHAPTCKTVQKSYARLFYNDFLANPDAAEWKDIKESIQAIDYETSLTDKTIEKVFMGYSKEGFEKKVKPTLHASTFVGNTYCASLYSSLASLLTKYSPEELKGKRVGAFAYGSGLASSFFSFTVAGDVKKIAESIALQDKLDRRAIRSPQEYNETMELREKAHLAKSYKPSGDVSKLTKGTYYLTEIDEKFRRSYNRV